MNTKKETRVKRKMRIRAKISGTASRPRLAVFRSNTKLYVQLIDDVSGKTLVSAATKDKNRASAKDLGLSVAQKAKEKKITSVVFDRGGFRYHGVVQILADAVREGGIKF